VPVAGSRRWGERLAELPATAATGGSGARGGLSARLRALRREATRQQLGPHAARVPERYWPNFTAIGGAAEHLCVLQRLIGAPPLDILVVGVFGGRDFWGLHVAGHRVTGFDFAAIPDCRPSVRGNAEAPWPFADARFDVVVLGEILEHLIHDWQALREARRVLRPGGCVVGSVPFLYDENDYHVRIHNPASIRRLLRAAGYEVDAFLERPGLVELRILTPFHHAVALAGFLLTGRSLYPTLARLYARWEWWLGGQGWGTPAAAEADRAGELGGYRPGTSGRARALLPGAQPAGVLERSTLRA